MSLPQTMKTRIYLDHMKLVSRALQGAVNTAANQKVCMQAMHGPNCAAAQRAEQRRAMLADHQRVIDAVVAKAQQDLSGGGGGTP